MGFNIFYRVELVL